MRRTLIVLLTLGLLAAGGWWWSQRPGPDLETLREDAFASWVPAGATLEREHQTRSGSTLGKPRYAHVTRVLDLGTRDAAKVLDEVVTMARAGGWTPGTRRDRAVGATRQVPGYRLELVAVVADVTGLEGDLVVTLTAYPA